MINVRDFAVSEHKKIGQTYGTKGYHVHLDDVHKLTMFFAKKKSFYEKDIVILDKVSYLHDIIEDTKITKEKIAELFGLDTAIVVELVTDIKAENRKKTKELTNLKYSQYDEKDFHQKLALFFKPIDRLANFKYSIEQGEFSKVKMYFKEYPEFKKAVYRQGINDDVWYQLDYFYDIVKRKKLFKRKMKK